MMFLGTDANASAWSRSNNELLIISRADYFRSDLGTINVTGNDVPGKFERLESNTYVEFGATSKIMIGGKAFYGTSWLTRGSDVEVATGFTEVEAFAQYQVFRSDRHAGAVKVAGGIPANFDSGARPSLSSDGADLEVSALYGRSIIFQPVKIFAAAEIGLRKRFSDSADQVRFLTTFGIEPSDRWTILLDTYSVKSLENERAEGVDFDIFKVQPSLVWQATDRISIQTGITEEVAGRNIALGRTFFLGLRTSF